MIGPDGENDYVRQLKHLVATVDCDIRFLGALPDEQIRDIYGAADFFCLTGVPDSSGRVEGFGLVYLEAAAGGLPSVATAIGGVPDAVLDDETGLLVPPSIEDIARAIANSPRIPTRDRFSPPAPRRMPARCPGNAARPKPTVCRDPEKYGRDRFG